MKTPSHACASAFFAVVLTLCAAAVAQTPNAQLLADLGSSNYETRRLASIRLMADETLKRQDIDRLYAASTTAEQRLRLIEVARHHAIRDIYMQRFAEDPRGSLGVTLRPVENGEQQGLEHPAILVLLTFPGFPAFAHLLPGDFVTAINGEHLPAGLDGKQTSDRFIEIIKSHRPGDMIELELQREGKTHTVRFSLAPFGALSELFEEGAGILRGQPRLKAQYQAIWAQREAELHKIHPPAPPLRITPQ